MHDAMRAQTGGGIGTGRLLQLEGLRGLAAVTVVVWHFLWAFAPWELGTVAGWPSQGLASSVATALMDGPAAVALFFVLSGFVIPLRLFRSGQSRAVVEAAAKRWPRLAGLTLLAVLFAYVLFHFGLFHYREAGDLTGSDWLASYGGGEPGRMPTPSLAGALHEGLVGAFLNNSDAYDPVLWTMRHELFGSFLSMALALVIRRLSIPACGIVLISVATLATAVDPWLLSFVAGTGLAFVIWTRQARLSVFATSVSISIGLFLFGYLEPAGAYSFIPVIQDAAGYRYDRILLHTMSGLLIILGLVGNERVGRALTARPLLLMGRLSFPVYVFHFPLLCSLGCGLFVVFRQSMSYEDSIVLVAAIYASAVLLTGGMLVRVDDAWGAWLNRLSRLLLAQGARALASLITEGRRRAVLHQPRRVGTAGTKR
jgi:peptidoglycan/LPS O-acetylase OafA/YrhL